MIANRFPRPPTSFTHTLTHTTTHAPPKPNPPRAPHNAPPHALTTQPLVTTFHTTAHTPPERPNHLSHPATSSPHPPTLTTTHTPSKPIPSRLTTYHHAPFRHNHSSPPSTTPPHAFLPLSHLPNTPTHLPHSCLLLREKCVGTVCAGPSRCSAEAWCV